LRRERLLAQRGARGSNIAVIRGALRRRYWPAIGLAERLRGPPQPRRSLRPPLGACDCSQTFHAPSDAGRVPEFSLNRETLPVATLACAAAPLANRQTPQIPERTGAVPLLAQLPPDRQALLEELLCGSIIPLAESHIPQAGERGSDA